MRSRALPVLVSAGLAAITALPYVAHATGIPYFGPIIPSNYNDCPLGWAAVIQVLNNFLAFAMTMAIVFVAPLSIAYAGFLFVISPTNPGERNKAKDVLWNTVIGIVIALAAYLIVDAMLTVFTSTNVAGWTSQVFGNGGAICLPQTSSTGQIGNTPGVTGVTPGGAVQTNPAGNGISYSQVPKQTSVQAGSLSSLLNCMAGSLPPGAGTVTAITDHYTEASSNLIAHCDAVGHAGDSQCVHAANSCHYGGSCGGLSYAADISGNISTLEQAATACDSKAWLNNEGSHLHVSTGAESGCGCDTSGSNNL